jgi:hypothetical protein
MKITISGSIAFYEEMNEIKRKLESAGHIVFSPEKDATISENREITIEEKARLMISHLKEVESSDVLLVYNQDKNNIPNYIGPNTLIEMALAFYKNKKIFLFNDIPNLNYSEEIIAMNPTEIHGDLAKIEA